MSTTIATSRECGVDVTRAGNGRGRGLRFEFLWPGDDAPRILGESQAFALAYYLHAHFSCSLRNAPARPDGPAAEPRNRVLEMSLAQLCVVLLREREMVGGG